MPLLLEPGPHIEPPPTGWRTPAAWLREHNLGRGFWTFCTAAFFFDAGFSVYFFLFNLYLLDLHFNDRAIGLIAGALTLGSMAGTLPAGALARRFGLRPLLIFCFIAAPSAGALRAICPWQPAQLVLAFFAGMAMCAWGVCYLPTVAGLTTEKNRPAAFSLIYSISVGCSSLGALLCGDLPHWLSRAGWSLPDLLIKRFILLGSCVLAAAGLSAILRLRLPAPLSDSLCLGIAPAPVPARRRFHLDPFLLRFLAAMSLWSVVLAAFSPLANVYLSRDLHVPLARIGLIFAGSQLLQLCGGLLNPLLFRTVGLVNGIAVTQLFTALALGLLARTQSVTFAVTMFLTFSAAQWMSSPGLYNLLMNETPEQDRSRAAALTMFCNAVAGSIATAVAGTLFTQFGYAPVLMGIAVLALAVATFCRILMRPQPPQIRSHPTDSGTEAAPVHRAG